MFACMVAGTLVYQVLTSFLQATMYCGRYSHLHRKDLEADREVTCAAPRQTVATGSAGIPTRCLFQSAGFVCCMLPPMLKPLAAVFPRRQWCKVVLWKSALWLWDIRSLKDLGISGPVPVKKSGPDRKVPTAYPCWVSE